MPATNEQFIKRAFEAGLNEDQVRAAVAERNQRTTSVQPQSSGDSKPVYQQVADFLGLGTTAKNVSTALNFGNQGLRTDQAGEASSQAFQQSQALTKQAQMEQDPAKKTALLNQARSIMSGSAQNMETFTSDLNTRQSNSGISEEDLGRSNIEFAARRGLGQSGELASWLIPGKIATAPVSAVGRLGQAGLRGGVAGGFQGVTEASNNAESVGEAATDIAGSSALGAIMGVGIQGAFETPGAVKDALVKNGGKIAPTFRKMYRGTLKDNIGDQKFYKQFGGEDKVVDEAIKFQLPNTKNGMNKAFEQYQDEFGTIVKSELAKPENLTKKINLTQIRKEAEKRALKQLESDLSLQKSAKSWFKANESLYKGKADLSRSNELRQGLDKTVGGQLAADINQGQTAAKKALATELRKAFKTEVPALNEPSRKYQLMSGLVDAMKKEPSVGITEVAAAAPAAMAAFLSGNIPLGFAAAASPFVMNKAVRSPGFRRGIATSGLNALSVNPNAKAMTTKPVEFAVNPMIQAMQRAIDNENESKQSRKRLP